MIDFTLKKVTMKRFRSFREETSFMLDRKPGLYFITGKNVLEPRLGGNGCGKSTIFDSIVWCLYGKTIGGLRGRVIQSGQTGTATVTLELLKDNILYTITRTQDPNSLKVSPSLSGETTEEVVVQADIDKFIGLDYAKFIYCLIVGQFNATFLDLGPTEKLDLFSTIMDLTMWEHCSKEASTIATDFQNKSELLASKKEGVESRLSALKAEEDRLRLSKDGFEAEREDQLKTLKNKSIQLLREIKVEEFNEKALNEKISDCNIRLSQNNEQLELQKKDLDSILKDRDEVLLALNFTQGTKNSLSTIFGKWKDLVSNACPVCEQEVPADIASAHKLETTKKILSLGKDIKAHQESLKSIEARVDTSKFLGIGISNKIKELQYLLDGAKASLANCNTTKSVRLQALEQTKEFIKAIKEGENPYSKLLEECVLQVLQASTDLEKILLDISENDRELTAAKYWSKGFKELRLWVVSDALLALAIESNSALSSLGLLGWKLKFHMERETSTGDISRGFHVLVHSSAFEEDSYVPFRTWSGGESQRLKLAGVVGLSSLIKNYRGIDFNISVWDEPSSYLSGEGIDDLIHFLSEEAISKGKVVYFIDHRQLEAAEFKSIIKVTKDENGSGITEGAGN